MKSRRNNVAAGVICFLWLVGVGVAQTPAPAPEKKAEDKSDKLVYADFETMQNNRPVSSRGGYVQIGAYQENPGQSGVIKGLAEANPPAPELVRLKQDDPNKAATFDYQIRIPNNYAGVSLEVHGLPDQDGKTVPDDVSNYKYLTLQVYATGTTYLRVEFVSRGQGFNLPHSFPQTSLKVSPGFNTYKLALKSLAQPRYAPERVDAKELLKKLTQINITVACEGGCVPLQGTIVVDNIIFQN